MHKLVTNGHFWNKMFWPNFLPWSFTHQTQYLCQVWAKSVIWAVSSPAWFCPSGSAWFSHGHTLKRLRLVSIWLQTIADDRGSQIADRRRSQRELFPYNRRRSQAIAEPTVAYISDSGTVKVTRVLCWREIAANNMADVEEEILLQTNLFLLLVNLVWNSLGTASRSDPEGSVFNRFR